jgi:hypothetical protein
MSDKCEKKGDHYRQRGPFQKLAFQKEVLLIEKVDSQITWESSSAAREALYYGQQIQAKVVKIGRICKKMMKENQMMDLNKLVWIQHNCSEEGAKRSFATKIKKMAERSEASLRAFSFQSYEPVKSISVTVSVDAFLLNYLLEVPRRVTNCVIWVSNLNTPQIT